jgi:hypothetical protein
VVIDLTPIGLEECAASAALTVIRREGRSDGGVAERRHVAKPPSLKPVSAGMSESSAPFFATDVLTASVSALSERSHEA